MSATISIQSLTKFYGQFKGIENINLEINKGEFFGFIGPNGAGKSTTIRSLMGLLRPTSGKAQILGLDTQRDGVKLRSRIGYLPSEVNYYDEMTSRELLEYSARFYPKSNLDQIETLAQRLDLNLDKNIEELSFGNKKKCAIIQCLLHQPEVLILDEPSSGLDPLIQNRFFEILHEQNKAGVTILYSSHVLTEIQRHCSRTAVIKDGEIVAVEDMESLLRKQMKRVKLQFEQPKPDLPLPQGGKDASWTQNELHFRFIGDIQELLTWINGQPVVDVTLEDPDLESIFMNYYTR